VHVLAVQKVLSGSSSAGRFRLMGKYIDHRLVARPEPDNTFWTAVTKHEQNKMLKANHGPVMEHAHIPRPLSRRRYFKLKNRFITGEVKNTDADTPWSL